MKQLKNQNNMQILKKNSKSIKLLSIAEHKNSIINESFIGEFYYTPIGGPVTAIIDNGIYARLNGSRKIIIELSSDKVFSNENLIRISTNHDWPAYDYDDAITVMIKPYPRSFKIAVAFFNKKQEKYTTITL